MVRLIQNHFTLLGWTSIFQFIFFCYNHFTPSGLGNYISIYFFAAIIISPHQGWAIRISLFSLIPFPPIEVDYCSL